MIKVPRASLIVTLLDDQDYLSLCRQRNGFEAFGLFTAVLIAGRERLGRKRASRIEGTESLRFDDLTEYVLTRIQASEKQLERCLVAFADVAKKTDSKPWVYRDRTGHLVIKSFFKFNGSDGWGGSRDGSGRKSKGNQDASLGNQDDSNLKRLETNLESTWSRSDRDSYSDLKTEGGTPNPLSGGSMANDPLDSADEIHPDDKPPKAPLPKVQNDPAEVARVGLFAEEALAGVGYRRHVEQDAARHKIGYIEEAIIEARDSGKTDWRYVRKIYERFTRDGQSNAEKAAKNGKAKPREPPPRPVPPVHVAPADSPYRRPPKPRTTDESGSR